MGFEEGKESLFAGKLRAWARIRNKRRPQSSPAPISHRHPGTRRRQLVPRRLRTIAVAREEMSSKRSASAALRAMKANASGNISEASLVYQRKYLPGAHCKPRLL